MGRTYSKGNACICFKEILIDRMASGIRYIDDDAFQGLSSLAELLLSSSKLSHPPSLHHVCRTLEFYCISYANISSFPEEYFKGCTLLKRITIFQTSIHSIPAMNYSHATLTDLSLTNNAIVDIQCLYNISFPVLRTLNLAENRIMLIEPDLMTLPVIQNIILRDNCLTELPDMTQSGWAKGIRGDDIVNLVGAGNPWNCTSAMLETLNGMSAVSPHIEITDLSDWICHSPPDLTGKIITDVGEV